jgi:hypothetical protein
VGDGGTLLTSPDGVAWTPRTPGTYDYRLQVTHGKGTFVVVGFSGTILQSDPITLFVDPGAANFGNADVGTVSTPKAFTVTNQGEVDVVISSIELAGTDPGDFTLQSDSCTGQTLAALESCTSEISFSPQLFGLKTALLRVTSSAPVALELDVPLSGTGVQGHTVVALFLPNGGESISSGSPYEILWGALPEATTFKLFYSLDNGTIWKRINTGAPLTGSSYLWQVPKTGGNKKRCLIKIIAYGSSGLRVGNDRSDGPFSIEVVKLTEPNGGGLPLKSGDPLTITWTTYATIEPVTKVLLSYTLDGGLTWKKIPTPPTFTGNPGSFDWTVPNVKKPKAKCKVKVVLKDAKGVVRGSDISDNYFTISP